MDEKERKMVDQIRDYLYTELRDKMDDPEFWEDEEKTVEYIKWLLYRKLRFVYPCMHVDTNEETGEITFTVNNEGGPYPRFEFDINMDRCPMCHAEMELMPKDGCPNKWWHCPMCNYEMGADDGTI